MDLHACAQNVLIFFLISKLSTPIRNNINSTGLNKVPCGCPALEDSHSREVLFHSHLPDGQGMWQVANQLNH